TFSDHHRYTQRDILAIKQAGKRAGAVAFVTTEKDAQNLRSAMFEGAQLYVAVIAPAVAPEIDFRNILEQTLATGAGAAACGFLFALRTGGGTPLWRCLCWGWCADTLLTHRSRLWHGSTSRMFDAIK